MTLPAGLDELYRTWARDDAVWSNELAVKFGKAAGDARYQMRGKGEPNSRLRLTHDRRQASQDAFYAAGGAEYLQRACLQVPNIPPMTKYVEQGESRA